MTAARTQPLRYLPHIAAAALMSLIFVMVLVAVGDPMVAAMLTLLLAIPSVYLLWGDRANARHRS
jgi:Flp pilus assembly protein TadB